MVETEGHLETRIKEGTKVVSSTEDLETLDLSQLKNMDTTDLLGNIVSELKIMNMHLSLITDTTIRRQEVE